MAFEHSLRVRFQHCDPAGIVFFANILVFCHEAYEELLRAGGAPLDELIAKKDQILPLGQAEVSFKRPIKFGQLIRIRVTVGKLSERSFQLDYELLDEASLLLASASTVHIAVDPANGKAVGLAVPLRDLLQKHELPAG
jgi:1,4-dihydroxy-2-naphthoyl-CoA hydrolase